MKLMNNFILLKDNILSQSLCEKIIKDLKSQLKKDELNTKRNYEYFDINKNNYFFKILDKCFDNMFEDYLKKYPEIQFTQDKFGISNFRFKYFSPGKHYEIWHSEHNINYPHRILNFTIYLSDHNCGTQFFRDELIHSKVGRGLMFPAYFTHTHKGTVCPDNKDRYIITGYLNFLNEGVL